MSAGPSVAPWLRPVVGSLAGLAVIAAVAVVAALPGFPWPSAVFAPASVEIAPETSGQTLVCTGGLLVVGRDSTAADSISIAAPQSVATAGESAIDRQDLDAEVSGGSALVLRSQPGGAPFAAAGSSTVGDADLSGFSASACRVPVLDSWLVAGAGTTGAADLVVLANPGEVAATVTLTVYGAAGEEIPPGGEGIVVAAGSERVIPVAGIALGEESPVIHIQASGAPVTGSLQSSITRLLEPGGVDQAGALTELRTRQSIIGVTVTAAGTDVATGAAPTLVRVLSPTTPAQATVTVTAVGSTEPAREPLTVSLLAGIPAAIEIPDLPVGTYVVTIDADTPVAAALWQTTGFAAASDFAWYAPSPVIDGAAVIAAPPGSAPVLTVMNPDAQEVVVEVQEGGSAPTALTIPAGASVQLPLRSETPYTLSGGPVLAAVGYSGAGALASFPVWPSDAGREPLTVYP